MRISIVIPTHNRRALLDSALERVAVQAARLRDVEVIVVNDGGRPISLPDSMCGVPVRYLEQANRGPAAARNAGARISSGEILVFMDDDCAPCEGWLESLMAVYARHPDAGGVAGALTVRKESSLIGYWESREFVPLFNKLNAAFGTSFRDEGRVWFHFGCNASYRRDVFERAGGFNENLRLMEDTDLQWRLHESGEPVYYTPSAVVEHNGGRSLAVETRRCYRCGRAYREFCLLHPGYREVASSGSSGGGLLKSVISSLRRAAGYTSSPLSKCYLITVCIAHRLMYALGYFSHRPSRSRVRAMSGLLVESRDEVHR